MTKYYFIRGFNKIAKIEKQIPYVYSIGLGWIPNNLIIRCQMGGHLDYYEISEKDVKKKIKELIG